MTDRKNKQISCEESGTNKILNDLAYAENEFLAGLSNCGGKSINESAADPTFYSNIPNNELADDDASKSELIKSHADDNDDEEFWVFGYGSLVWKVDFPIECSQKGYIKGFLRRFYQNSIDHRGTAERPGRVVTLIPSPDLEYKVWGMAYKIADDKKIDVLRHLDYREKNGYERHTVNFYPYPQPKDGRERFNRICIYVATQDNASFAGPTEIAMLAKQIQQAVGPSGKNTEYVYKLADAMRMLFPGEIDYHLFELEDALKKMAGES